MTREDVVRRLAYLVRHDHHTACMMVGWFVQNCDQETLEAALELAEGSAAVMPLGDHLALVRERYSRWPGGAR